MKRTIKPSIGDTLDSYWRKCEGRFLDKWYIKSLEYIKKNLQNNQELIFDNGQWKVINK